LKKLTSEQAEIAKAVVTFDKRLISENTSLRASLEEQSEELLLVNYRFEVLQQRLKSQSNNLSKRVAVNEEAVEAIDASRQYLLARSRQLQKQVDQLLPTEP
jgi:peptidoglycan hydrolase CwlO-like protein